MVSTRSHALVDYASSAVLLVAPGLLGFPRGARRAARVKAATALVANACTDHELGVVRRIPMRAHLAADVASGALFALSPWALGYRTRDPRSWLPHVVAGLGDTALALLTARAPASPAQRPEDELPRTSTMPGADTGETPPGSPPSTPQHTVTEGPRGAGPVREEGPAGAPAGADASR